MPHVFGGLATELGNVGLPAHNLLYAPRVNGFSTVSIPFWREEVPYYHTRRPFTYAYYTQGTAEEQQVEVWHTQNISPLFNMALGYKRLGNSGMYQSQNVVNNRFFVSGNAGNDTTRLQLKFFYRRQLWDNTFNGGLENDSVFEQNLIPAANPKLYPFNLSGVRARVKTNTFNLESAYTLTQFNPDTRLKWKQFVTWENSFWQYREDNPVDDFYFNNYHFGTDTIKDNFHFISTTLAEGIEFSQAKNWTLGIFAGNQWGTYMNQSNDSVFISPFVQVGASYLLGKWSFKLYERFFVGGFNTGKHDANFSSHFKPDSVWSFSFEGYYNSLNPELNTLRYASSRFVWQESTILPVNFYGAKFKTSLKDLIYAEISAHTLTNPIYFNNAGNRAQEAEQAHILQVLLGGNWEAKHAGVFWKAAYQYTGGYQVIPLPEWVGQVGGYVDLSIFKRALKLRPGVSLKYWSEYYAPGFVPATGSYHIQREKELGNYPFVDAFIVFNIKTVNLYILMTHLNSGLMGNTYYDALHYPSRQRAFRLGLNWNFWN